MDGAASLSRAARDPLCDSVASRPRGCTHATADGGVAVAVVVSEGILSWWTSLVSASQTASGTCLPRYCQQLSSSVLLYGKRTASEDGEACCWAVAAERAGSLAMHIVGVWMTRVMAACVSWLCSSARCSAHSRCTTCANSERHVTLGMMVSWSSRNSWKIGLPGGVEDGWEGERFSLEAAQKDRQTDRQTDRQIGRQTDRQTDRQTNKTDRQTDRQTDGQTDRQTDRQTYKQTDRQTD